MISIRIATESDVDAIVRLTNTAFVVEQFFIERDRTNPATVRSLMNVGKFLLVDDGPNLAGSVYTELRGDRGYFGMLSVDPARQGMGIGRRLVDAAEKYFREAGCKFSDLKIVDVRTNLRDIYRRWGFVETGSAPYDDPTPTKMPVQFITLSKPLL